MNIAQRIQNCREIPYRMFTAAQVPAKSQSMGQLQGTRKSHYWIETDTKASLVAGECINMVFQTFYTTQQVQHRPSAADRTW